MPSNLGSHSSPWQDAAGTLNTMATLPDEVADVAVLGAGVFGATTALVLAEQGQRVVMIDATDPLRDSTTARSTVKVTVGQGTRIARIAGKLGDDFAVTHVQANQAGMDLVAAQARHYAPDSDMRPATQLVYARDRQTAEALRHTAELMRRAGTECHLDEEVDLPWTTEATLSFPDQLALHPGKYLRGLIRAAIEAGATVCFGVRAVGIDDGDPVTVQTDSGTLRAVRVVIASHYPFLLRGLHFAQLKAVRHHGIVVLPERGIPTEMTYDASSPTRSTRSVHIDGTEHLIVVGEAHDTGTGDIDSRPTRHWDSLVEWTREACGVLHVRHHWAAQDLDTPDGAPLLGQLSPGNNRLYTGCGFGAWGMTNGTFAAHLLAGHLTGTDHPWWELWHPTRLGSVGATATLAKWQGQVGARLTTGLLKGRLGSPDQLSTGEAGVFRSGTRQVAAYRDELGGLHQVSARCTHLGCTVKWNAGEKSWDCPCHGSRFGVDGEVLEAPATRPLDPIE